MDDVRRGFATSGRAWPLAAGIFVAVVVAVVALNLPSMPAGGIETGDFAANSLLVQDAKHLTLLVGNYSRVGFNHPGPALLYILAAGEVVFHDVLHVVPSPFAGQMIAVGLLKAWCVATLFVTMRRMGTTTGAVAATAVFLVALSLLDAEFVPSLWFPHLYAFPFAVMIAAIARLAAGSVDALFSLAVASGLLANGHVAFIPILGLMLLGALATNAVLARDTPSHRILSGSFLRGHARRIVAAVAVFALFFAPLAIATISRFPGPVADYLRFGAGRRPNLTRDVFDFVGGYTGGLVGLAGLAALWFVVWRTRRPNAADARASRAFVAVLITATVAMLLYARYGVDFLAHRYIGLFYDAVPSLTYALVALIVVDRMAGRTGRIVATLAVAACTVAAVVDWRNLPEHTAHYAVRGPVEMARALASRHGERRVVVEIDAPDDVTALWPQLAGVALDGRRNGADPLCLDRDWLVLFTDAYACRRDELVDASRVVARPVAATITADLGAELLRADGVAYHAYAPPDIPSGTRIDAVADAPLFEHFVLDRHWFPIDHGRFWSFGPRAYLLIPIPRDGGEVATLDLEAALQPGLPTRHLVVSIAGRRVAEATFSADRNRQPVRVPLGRERASAVDLQLDLDTAPAAAPRAGGVALYGFVVSHGS